VRDVHQREAGHRDRFQTVFHSRSQASAWPARSASTGPQVALLQRGGGGEADQRREGEPDPLDLITTRGEASSE
jgi:hypothetical protein